MLFRMPSIGPVFIGSVLKEHGYQVRIFSEPVKRVTRGNIESLVSSALRAMSVLTFGAHRAYALAHLIGQMNERAVTVRGDVPATIRPEPCWDHGDVGVRRAGEDIMLERLDYLKGPDEWLHRLNHIDGIRLWRNDGKVHHPKRSRPRGIDTPLDFSLVDSLVRKDWKIKTTEGRQTMSVLQASRGCPVACKFCLGSSLLGAEYRTKDMDVVRANLDLVRAYNVGRSPVVFFNVRSGFKRDDDVFLEGLTDEGSVVLGRKPAISQHIAIGYLVLLAHAQHRSYVLIFRTQALALDPTGLHLTKENGFVNQRIRHRQTHAVGVIHAVEQVEALDRPVLAVIVMPTDQIVLIGMRLLLDRVIHNQDLIILLDVAHQRLDGLPPRLAVIVGTRQKPRDLIVADRPVHQSRPARGRGRAKRTEQIIAMLYNSNRGLSIS